MFNLQIFVILFGIVLTILIAWYFWFTPKAQTRVAISESGAQKKVAITVKGGYTPDVIFVQKGRPVLLTFTWQESSACSEKVLFPDFNQNALLPEGVNRSHWNSRPRKQANTASNARWACCAAS